MHCIAPACSRRIGQWFRPMKSSRAYAAKLALSLALFCTWSGARAQGILYVNPSAPPGGNGMTWAGALNELRDALARAPLVRPLITEIWVARGTYRPAPPNGDRNASFALQNGLAIYAGFNGTESSRDQRNSDPTTNATILS